MNKLIFAINYQGKNSQFVDFCKSFWQDNQDGIIQFGKMLMMSILVLLLVKFITLVLKKIILKKSNKLVVIDESIKKIFYTIFRITLYLVAGLIILDIWGFNTAGLLTVLGATGLAIVLALKDSLSNIASGIILLILRPYKLGDSVACGTVNGKIKEMGLFSTIITNFEGIYVSVPNSVIFGHPITNYSRNDMRLAILNLRVSYSNSLERVIKILQNFLQDTPLILDDPPPEIQVAELGDIAIVLTLRFWVATENYSSVYWQVKRDVKTVLEQSGITIPHGKSITSFFEEKNT